MNSDGAGSNPTLSSTAISTTNLYIIIAVACVAIILIVAAVGAVCYIKAGRHKASIQSKNDVSKYYKIV